MFRECVAGVNAAGVRLACPYARQRVLRETLPRATARYYAPTTALRGVLFYVHISIGGGVQTDEVLLDMGEAQGALQDVLTEGDLTYLALEDFQRQWRKLGNEMLLFPPGAEYADGSCMEFDEDEAIARWESCLELACAAEQQLSKSVRHLISSFSDFSRFLQDGA